MPLPYLNSYNDPKTEKAYRRYIDGGSQRAIVKALKIPARTLARYCKNDGWESERQARAVTEEAPNVAAVAAGSPDGTPSAAKSEPAAAKPKAERETRTVGMERVLARQQRIAGRLVEAYERDVDKTMADAETKPLSRSQIAQLTNLGSNLMALERKAWCVPDKIETKDTTPTAEDRVRKLNDADLDRQLAEAERAASSSVERETPEEGVN